MIETGRFIASITILFFYILLYKFWSIFYKKEISRNKNYLILFLGIAGVVLSGILKDNTEYLLVMLRNIPLLVIGLIVILEYKKESIVDTGKSLKFIWLALLLSLIFTVSFELLSTNFEFFIILMMPKTLMFKFFKGLTQLFGI